MTDIPSSSNTGNIGSFLSASSAIGIYSGMVGVNWREDQKEQKFSNRRRSIITIINKFAQQHNITTETDANVAEERCSGLNKSLHHLAEHNDQIFK
ncbi:hypothetical protein [Absidia glauca]|uniref:Transcription activator GCR1-like domain-containing protein n=1 Tax=Absidia glauca TaxID=4829 RepID=A0A168Q8S0_ABSGL|nr:hypothetical protein [Absidia glauca]